MKKTKENQTTQRKSRGFYKTQEWKTRLGQPQMPYIYQEGSTVDFSRWSMVWSSTHHTRIGLGSSSLELLGNGVVSMGRAQFIIIAPWLFGLGFWHHSPNNMIKFNSFTRQFLAFEFSSKSSLCLFLYFLVLSDVDALCSTARFLQRATSTTCSCSCNGSSHGLLGARAIAAKLDRWSSHSFSSFPLFHLRTRIYIYYFLPFDFSVEPIH